MTERADLPDLEHLDSEALKALIRAQHAEILRQNQALLSKDEQLQSRDAEIEHLKLLISKLRREQYGRSSEKLDRQIAQLDSDWASSKQVAPATARGVSLGETQLWRVPPDGRCRRIFHAKCARMRRLRATAGTVVGR
jgi:hypothetical protein